MSNPRPPYSNGVAAGSWTSNGLCLRNARGQSTIAHARSIGRTLGTFKAARYLRKRGWSIEAALHILTSPSNR